MHFADRLLARCREVGSPICVGIDPVYERLPRSLRRRQTSQASVRAKTAANAIDRFVQGVFEAIQGTVACVKVQSACFERYLWPGVEAYHRLIGRAKEMGFIVIADVKRGDIGISASHYAAGCLANPAFPDLGLEEGPDALTVSTYFGQDGISPFLDLAAGQNKGVFALVRTSNPSSDSLQALRLEDGRTVAQAVAQQVADFGSDPSFLGQAGYSLLGAVVGATKPQDAVLLRQMMPQQLFLVPGVGAQGAEVKDLHAFFNPDQSGAIVTASRSILYAYENRPDADWQKAIAQATQELKLQIASLFSAAT